MMFIWRFILKIFKAPKVIAGFFIATLIVGFITAGLVMINDYNEALKETERLKQEKEAVSNANDSLVATVRRMERERKLLEEIEIRDEGRREDVLERKEEREVIINETNENCVAAPAPEPVVSSLYQYAESRNKDRD